MCLCGNIGLLKRVVNILHLLRWGELYKNIPHIQSLLTCGSQLHVEEVRIPHTERPNEPPK